MKNKNMPKKKPYTPPRIDSKEIYEVNALGCTKCPRPSNISASAQCKLGVIKFS